MLHVSAGHERGIGLEVFLKSFLCLAKRDQERITLHCRADILLQTTKQLGLRLPSELNLIELPAVTETLTLQSLHSALGALKPEDRLFTLPTSKDQLKEDGIFHLGYTEYLRHRFKSPNLIMSFKAPNAQIALLTDHIPLKDFVSQAASAPWEKKLEEIFRHCGAFYGLNEFYIAGVNPHAGEGGLLGSEDLLLAKVIERLKKKHSSLSIQGPLPGDTMHLKSREDNLLVYLYHDQGLTWFKGVHGLIGANITLGLPFIRLSVDHGTAFDLYGKNKADYRGCLYCLRVGLDH